MASRRRSATLYLAALAIVNAACVCSAYAQAVPSTCGSLGQACCCKVGDYANEKCCGQGLQCLVFMGQGFSILSGISQLCAPKQPNQQACGFKDGPCCLTASLTGSASATCGNGLVCAASSIGWASKAQYAKLNSGFTAAVRSPAVMGSCTKFTSALCGKAYMPCGKDAAAAGVTCPGNLASCPSGFYCAAQADAGVGERCIPIPSDAGKLNGPCLPNNLKGAPIVKHTGKEQAPPFCSGSAVCFASTTVEGGGLTYDQPKEAKNLASRISGTKCLSVPADCGSAPGKPCCPSGAFVVTDKPLPSQGKKWEAAPCDNDSAKYGVYCNGNFVALSGETIGACVANPACGGQDMDCCQYSNATVSGSVCPQVAPVGSGKGYCSNSNKCKSCPNPLVTVEDIFRCY